MSKFCTVIENGTGEILSNNFKVETLEDKIRKKENVTKKRLKDEFKVLQSEYLGNFIFYIFKDINELQKILTDAELVKFIYMGTYVKSNGALMHDNNLTYVTKKELQYILKIGGTLFHKFYNKLIDNKLIKEDNKIIYININYFWYGKETKYKKLMGTNLKDFTRLYIKTTRDLYILTETKNHKKLAIIYKLIPYINWKYNVICNNTNETEKGKIDLLTIGDILSLLGYNKTNISRFKKDFYSLQYKEYQIFKTVQSDANYNNSIILVNPLVIYRGNDIKELEYLIALFELKPLKLL